MLHQFVTTLQMVSVTLLRQDGGGRREEPLAREGADDTAGSKQQKVQKQQVHQLHCTHRQSHISPGRRPPQQNLRRVLPQPPVSQEHFSGKQEKEQRQATRQQPPMDVQHQYSAWKLTSVSHHRQFLQAASHESFYCSRGKGGQLQQQPQEEKKQKFQTRKDQQQARSQTEILTHSGRSLLSVPQCEARQLQRQCAQNTHHQPLKQQQEESAEKHNWQQYMRFWERQIFQELQQATAIKPVYKRGWKEVQEPKEWCEAKAGSVLVSLGPMRHRASVKQKLLAAALTAYLILLLCSPQRQSLLPSSGKHYSRQKQKQKEWQLTRGQQQRQVEQLVPWFWQMDMKHQLSQWHFQLQQLHKGPHERDKRQFQIQEESWQQDASSWEPRGISVREAFSSSSSSAFFGCFVIIGAYCLEQEQQESYRDGQEQQQVAVRQREKLTPQLLHGELQMRQGSRDTHILNFTNTSHSRASPNKDNQARTSEKTRDTSRSKSISTCSSVDRAPSCNSERGKEEHEDKHEAETASSVKDTMKRDGKRAAPVLVSEEVMASTDISPDHLPARREKNFKGGFVKVPALSKEETAEEARGTEVIYRGPAATHHAEAAEGGVLLAPRVLSTVVRSPAEIARGREEKSGKGEPAAAKKELPSSAVYEEGQTESTEAEEPSLPANVRAQEEDNIEEVSSFDNEELIADKHFPDNSRDDMENEQQEQQDKKKQPQSHIERTEISWGRRAEKPTYASKPPWLGDSVFTESTSIPAAPFRAARNSQGWKSGKTKQIPPSTALRKICKNPENAVHKPE